MRYNDNSPLISVIVTTYNRKELLKETIESILAQSYTNFELIVVDNESNYNFLNWINSFNDSRIKPYQNQNNGIIAINRNFGINHAIGDYIAFCDDDDIWEKEKLEIQLSYLLNNENLIGVGCQSSYFGADRISRNEICVNKKINFIVALSKKTVPLSSLMVKKNKVLFDVDRALLFVEDKDYQIQLILSSEKSILLLKDRLIRYRIHNDANSNSSSRKLNNIHIYNKYKALIPERLYLDLIAKAYIQAITVELRDNNKPVQSRRYSYKVLNMHAFKWKSAAIILILLSFMPIPLINFIYKIYYSIK